MKNENSSQNRPIKKDDKGLDSFPFDLKMRNRKMDFLLEQMLVYHQILIFSNSHQRH